jgi:DNA-binding CsgD family transcriptional regulator
MDQLSGREREIFELMGEGKSMTEIAAILGLAYKTVANTSLRLRDKVGAKGPAELVKMAVELRHMLPKG